jgi:hypothetical protein
MHVPLHCRLKNLFLNMRLLENDKVASKIFHVLHVLYA